MATHSGGQRMMLNPYEFGSNSPLEFLNNTNPDSAIQSWPHFDWSAPGQGVPERSWRFWEPGRVALSELGLVESDPDQTYATAQRAQGASIFGIKGDLLVKPVSAIFYDADTGLQLVNQPKYEQVFDTYELEKISTTWATTANYGTPEPTPPLPMASDPSFWSTTPLFVTMYTGSYSVTNDGYDEGGTIDAGPFDDPDTLMSLDITNPSVLESNRIAWWAMETFTMPHRSGSYTGVGFDDLSGAGGARLNLNTWTQGLRKLPLSLSHNWRIRKNQNLWMHVSFGITATPLILTLPNAEGVNTLYRIAYRAKAHYEIVGSMLVSPWAVK